MPDFTQPDNKCRLTIWQKCPLLILLRVSKSPSVIKNPPLKKNHWHYLAKVSSEADGTFYDPERIVHRKIFVWFLYKKESNEKKVFVYKKNYIFAGFHRTVYVLGRYSLVFIPPLIICFFFLFLNFFSSPYLIMIFETRHDKNFCKNLFTKCQQFVIFLMVFFKLGMKRCINYWR